MSTRIPTIHEVHDSKFSLSGGLEVLTSIEFISLPKMDFKNLFFTSPKGAKKTGFPHLGRKKLLPHLYKLRRITM
jgi:hypothetical protein